MQAITTKYLGPTNLRGSRVKASCDAGSITLPWNDALDADENHDHAARELCRKLGWDKDAYPVLYRGTVSRAPGNVYVFGADYCRVELRKLEVGR